MNDNVTTTLGMPQTASSSHLILV